MKHICVWVLRPALQLVPAKYCGKPVKYKIVKDDDGNLMRKYNSFCDHHQRLVDMEPEE